MFRKYLLLAGMLMATMFVTLDTKPAEAGRWGGRVYYGNRGGWHGGWRGGYRNNWRPRTYYRPYYRSYYGGYYYPNYGGYYYY